MADRIVRFTRDLLSPCARLYRDAFNAPPWDTKWTLAGARRHLREVFETPAFVGFAVLRDGAPIAFAIGNGEHWSNFRTFCLKEMCVRPDLQRQGIGTRLLHHLEAALKRRGRGGLYLLTLKNTPAARFYRRHGYFRIDPMIMMVHPLADRRTGLHGRRRSRLR